MKNAFQKPVLLVPFLAACATGSGVEWRTQETLQAEKVEMQVDAQGRVLEVEYHIRPGAVPAAVRAAMDRLHPGGEATGAEKEYVGATLYWELTKEIDGRAVEAMFLPDGSLHSEEIEVAASSVPEVVQAAVARRMSGQVTAWEEIRDGSRRLVEYHVKVTSSGMHYKLRVTSRGEVVGVVREVPAEIEVPVG